MIGQAWWWGWAGGQQPAQREEGGLQVKDPGKRGLESARVRVRMREEKEDTWGPGAIPECVLDPVV